MENKEVVNYLLAHNDLKIIQRKDMFNFSLDTVLLSQFCTINKDVRNIVDFGTNNAAIPLLLSKRTPKKITGIEIQEEAVELAKRNIQMNDLEEQIEIIHGDIKEVVNKAIANSERRASRKFFGGLKKKRSDTGDVIFLTEADFKD